MRDKLGRRSFLQITGGVGLAAAAGPVIMACGDDEENGQNSGNGLLPYAHGTTDSSGEVSLNGKGFRVIRDSDKAALVGITVHLWSDFSGRGFVQACGDGSKQGGKIYAPAFQQISGVTVPKSRGNVQTLTRALSIDSVLTMKDTIYNAFTEGSKFERGTFLGEDSNYNWYCMTRKQMETSYIDVPIGLIFLAPEAAGMKSKVIKNAVKSKLSSLFNAYILSKYGSHAGYRVGVPKDVVSLCGPEYTGMLCDLSDGQLRHVWDANRPVWMIKGPCTPNGGSKSCDDGDICTENDVYVGGKCKGTQIDCDDNDPCSKDYCVSNVKPGEPKCKHDIIPGCYK